MEFDGQEFVINTTEEMLYEILMQDENYKELTNAFKNFGINNFKIIKKDKKLSVSEQDLLILKQYFENIIIK